MQRSGGVLVAALGLVACGPTLGVHGMLAARAREQIGCDHMTRVVQLTENAFEVDGCGQMLEYTDALAGTERDFQSMTPAASLAAADTHCSYDQLQLVGSGEPTHRAFQGCGSPVSYTLRCADAGGCHWERDAGASAPVMPDVPAGYGSTGGT